MIFCASLYGIGIWHTVQFYFTVIPQKSKGLQLRPCQGFNGNISFLKKLRRRTKLKFEFWSHYPTLKYEAFLYARLQTDRIMVWWCPSDSPSVRPSVQVSVRQFSALFSYMLWHIELKFCTWLCFNVLQIKSECNHFAPIFEGVMPLCELRI